MLELSWNGTAVVGYHTGSVSVLADPYYSRNPDLITLRDEHVLQADAFFVTHGHFDHVADLGKVLRKNPRRIYLAADTAHHLQHEHRIPGGFLHAVRWGEAHQLGDLTLTGLPSKHIVFDRPLIKQTLRDLVGHRGRRYRRELAQSLRENRQFPMGTCVAWQIEHQGVRVLHLGSLALDPQQYYVPGMDWLVIPYQGHSRLHDKAWEAVLELKPAGIVLHHFDDTFPPISRTVDTEPFVRLMAARRPEIPVIVPRYHERIELGEVAAVDGASA